MSSMEVSLTASAKDVAFSDMILYFKSFGRLLHDTVSGEKLSASKVERVRDSAAKQFNVRSLWLQTGDID